MLHVGFMFCRSSRRTPVGIMVIAGEGSKILTGGCIEAAPANNISGRTPRIMTEVRLRAESVTRQWSAFGMVEFHGSGEADLILVVGG